MSQAQPIAELFAKRQGPNTAVLLGKGPSLDEYTGRPDGVDYVMGINEVPFAKDCDGVITGDRIFHNVTFPAHLDFFRYKHADSHGGRGYVYLGPKDVPQDDPRMLPVCPDGTGITCDAVCILALWGVRRLLLWGFDSMYYQANSYDELYAECIKPHIVEGGNKRWKYGHRGQALLRSLQHFDLDWTHHGQCVANC